MSKGKRKEAEMIAALKQLVRVPHPSRRATGGVFDFGVH